MALIRREPAAVAARRAIVERGSAGARLLVPDLFWTELINVMVKRYASTAVEVVEALREIDDLGATSVPIDRPLLLVAIESQQRYGLSAYDAIYLALAQSERADLLTLDRRLAAAAGERAVRPVGMHPPRLAEEAATYGVEPVDWARFGPYLAQLRAEARDPASGSRRV